MAGNLAYAQSWETSFCHLPIAEITNFRHTVLFDIYKAWRRRIDFADSRYIDHILVAPKIRENTTDLPELIHMGDQTVIGQINKIVPDSYDKSGKFENNPDLKSAILESFKASSKGQPSLSVFNGCFFLSRGMTLTGEFWRLSLPGKFSGSPAIICCSHMERDRFIVG